MKAIIMVWIEPIRTIKVFISIFAIPKAAHWAAMKTISGIEVIDGRVYDYSKANVSIEVICKNIEIREGVLI
jgi:hypothetical protein